MSKKSGDDFFTKKHARLTNFALAANIFAWIVFIVHIFLVWARYIEVQNTYTYQSIVSGQIADFAGMLKEKPVYAASLYLDMLGIFLRGVVFALVLKGVSLGLYILLENDLNKKSADDDESTPVFYKPQDVLWLEKWISRASIAVIGLTVVVSLFDFSRAKQMTSVYFTNQPGARPICEYSGWGINRFKYYICERALLPPAKIIELCFENLDGSRTQQQAF